MKENRSGSFDGVFREVMAAGVLMLPATAWGCALLYSSIPV